MQLVYVKEKTAAMVSTVILVNATVGLDDVEPHTSSVVQFTGSDSNEILQRVWMMWKYIRVM